MPRMMWVILAIFVFVSICMWLGDRDLANEELEKNPPPKSKEERIRDLEAAVEQLRQKVQE